VPPDASLATGAGTGGAPRPPRAAARPSAGLSARERRELDTYRDRMNAGVVGVVSGGIDGTYLRVATELAAVLDDAYPGLRVLPIAGRGSLQNIWDLVFARGVDVALVQSDVLAYAQREKIFPNPGAFIQYVASFYDEEVHVLAGKDAARVEDLAGKKVNVDVKGSGTAMTGELVFSHLGIPIEATNFDQDLALEKLKAGEIAALVYVVGKPARLFDSVPPDDGLHFLAVPPKPELVQTYAPARLTAEDYPRLVREGEAVETLAVSAVMAAYAWPVGSERYRKVARFVDAFFNHADAFQQSPRHRKWREISLAAPLGGWTRFPATEKWLRNAAAAHNDAAEYEQFMKFLDQVKPGGISNTAERDAIFAQFERWRAEGRAQGSSGPREPRRTASGG
jgi:TRAP transporter TAXI family solute receptor